MPDASARQDPGDSTMAHSHPSIHAMKTNMQVLTREAATRDKVHRTRRKPDDKQTSARPIAKTEFSKVPKNPKEIAADEARKARIMAVTESVSRRFGHLPRKFCGLTRRIDSSSVTIFGGETVKRHYSSTRESN